MFSMALTLGSDPHQKRRYADLDADLQSPVEGTRTSYRSNVAIRRSTASVPAKKIGTAKPHSIHQRSRILGLPSKVSKKKSKEFQGPNSYQRQVRLRGFPADVFHQEPFNAYPIATIGCVHQMVEYCEFLIHCANYSDTDKRFRPSCLGSSTRQTICC